MISLHRRETGGADDRLANHRRLPHAEFFKAMPAFVLTLY